MRGGFSTIAVGLLLLMSLSTSIVPSIDNNEGFVEIQTLNTLDDALRSDEIVNNSGLEPLRLLTNLTGSESWPPHLAINSNGDVYMIGNYQGSLTIDNYTINGQHSYVAKLSDNGSLQWLVNGDGNWSVTPSGIAIDSGGNSYITGYFSGTATFGASILSTNSSCVFVAKLNNEGSWEWATKVDCLQYDAPSTGVDIRSKARAHGIDVDSSGNSYITGYFSGVAIFDDINLTSTTSRSPATSYSDYSEDIFIAKISTLGSWEWAVMAGGPRNEQGTDLAVDSSGNCYIMGLFEETANIGGTNLTSSSEDTFIAKLSSTGEWLWANLAGDDRASWGPRIAIDSEDNVYYSTGGVVGESENFDNVNLSIEGSERAIFIVKLSSDGVGEWAVNATGSPDGSIEVTGIAVDSNGNVYVAGRFEYTASFGNTNMTSIGVNSDIFIAKLNSVGSWQWAVNASSPEYDVVSDIVSNSNGVVVFSGFFTEASDLEEGNPTVIGGFVAYCQASDIDNDGVQDYYDDFENDPNETTDSDGDGVGDNADAFPNDANESADSDLDGVGDNADAFPNDANETVDSDGDGVGDNSDFIPDDPDIRYPSDLKKVNQESDDTALYILASAISFFTITAIVVVIIVLKRKSDDDEDEEEEEEYHQHQQESNPYVSLSSAPPVFPVRGPPPAQPQHQNPWPDNQWYGKWSDDGYEWLEYPENSGTWYWRDQQTGQWVKH